MKNLLAIFSLLVLLSACNPTEIEEPITPPPPTPPIIELGQVSMLSNGMPWVGSFSISFNPNDHSRFSFGGKLKKNGYDHSFAISDITCREGIQVIEKQHYSNVNNGVPNAAYFVVLEEDQLLMRYQVDTFQTEHFIDIIHYDSITHIVEGRFQTYLEAPGVSSSFPKNLTITEGKFHLKIPN